MENKDTKKEEVVEQPVVQPQPTGITTPLNIDLANSAVASIAEKENIAHIQDAYKLPIDQQPKQPTAPQVDQEDFNETIRQAKADEDAVIEQLAEQDIQDIEKQLDKQIAKNKKETAEKLRALGIYQDKNGVSWRIVNGEREYLTNTDGSINIDGKLYKVNGTTFALEEFTPEEEANKEPAFNTYYGYKKWAEKNGKTPEDFNTWWNSNQRKLNLRTEERAQRFVDNQGFRKISRLRDVTAEDIFNYGSETGLGIRYISSFAKKYGIPVTDHQAIADKLNEIYKSENSKRATALDGILGTFDEVKFDVPEEGDGDYNEQDKKNAENANSLMKALHDDVIVRGANDSNISGSPTSTSKNLQKVMKDILDSDPALQEKYLKFMRENKNIDGELTLDGIIGNETRATTYWLINELGFSKEQLKYMGLQQNKYGEIAPYDPADDTFDFILQKEQADLATSAEEKRLQRQRVWQSLAGAMRTIGEGITANRGIEIKDREAEIKQQQNANEQAYQNLRKEHIDRIHQIEEAHRQRMKEAEDRRFQQFMMDKQHGQDLQKMDIKHEQDKELMDKKWGLDLAMFNIKDEREQARFNATMELELKKLKSKEGIEWAKMTYEQQKDFAQKVADKVKNQESVLIMGGTNLSVPKQTVKAYRANVAVGLKDMITKNKDVFSYKDSDGNLIQYDWVSELTDLPEEVLNGTDDSSQQALNNYISKASQKIGGLGENARIAYQKVLDRAYATAGGDIDDAYSDKTLETGLSLPYSDITELYLAGNKWVGKNAALKMKEVTAIFNNAPYKLLYDQSADRYFADGKWAKKEQLTSMGFQF